MLNSNRKKKQAALRNLNMQRRRDNIATKSFNVSKPMLKNALTEFTQEHRAIKSRYDYIKKYQDMDNYTGPKLSQFDDNNYTKLISAVDRTIKLLKLATAQVRITEGRVSELMSTMRTASNLLANRKTVAILDKHKEIHRKIKKHRNSIQD